MMKANAKAGLQAYFSYCYLMGAPCQTQDFHETHGKTKPFGKSINLG